MDGRDNPQVAGYLLTRKSPSIFFEGLFLISEGLKTIIVISLLGVYFSPMP